MKKGDIQILKNLAANKDVIVTKPDKGRGVVVLNRSDYINSMESIISDTSKFKPIEEPMDKFTLRIEDKINRFLLKIKNMKKITSEVYDKLRSTGSSPGILYGLPKIHKPDFATKFQFRPIFAAYKTPSYNLAKYLVPILSPLTTNQYSVENSYKFAEEIQDQDGSSGLVMASFDVENLFTNIPLQETIQIIAQQLFTSPVCTILGLTRDLFIQLLDLSVSNSFFLFNDKLYSQVDGLGMGLPLGPTFANIFLSFHEKSWLEQCPSDFKPVYFRRYVDDCFILFSSVDHIPKFLSYLNSKHANIKFTCELEQNCQISFLDCLITRVNNKFETSTFRKSTFTGLGTSYFSFSPFSFKINGIKTLINRGYKVTSNVISRNSEFNFLRQFFFNNGFPTSLINSQINKFLQKTNSNSDNSNELSNENFYVSLPYFGQQSEKFKFEINKLLNKYLDNHHIKLIFSNKHTIGSFFPYKDRLPISMRSSIVYQYSCESCSHLYIGSSTRNLYMRMSEHQGKSFRTGNLVQKTNSSIFDHKFSCDTQINSDNFKILDYSSSEFRLRILESLYIHKERPQLNDMQSAMPLLVVQH